MTTITNEGSTKASPTSAKPTEVGVPPRSSSAPGLLPEIGEPGAEPDADDLLRRNLLRHHLVRHGVLPFESSEGGEERLELAHALLEPAAMPFEDAPAVRRVAEDLGDLLQRHLERAEEADPFRLHRLRDGVVAVARIRVHSRRAEQPHLVVQPERLLRQAADRGEAPDGDQVLHVLTSLETDAAVCPRGRVKGDGAGATGPRRP